MAATYESSDDFIKCNQINMLLPWFRECWSAATFAAESKITAHNTASTQNLCASCRKSSICNPHRNYGVIATKCLRYVKRSGSAHVA